MTKDTLQEKSIKLGKETHKRLLMIKVQEEKSNLDEVINILIDCYDEHKKQ